MSTYVLGATTLGCTTDPDREDTAPIGESLHVVPEVFDDPAPEMTCRDVGLLLGHESAQRWVDCSVELEDLPNGAHFIDSPSDFGDVEYCAELLTISVDLYDTEHGRELDWTSLNRERVSAVLVKGAHEANLYVYPLPVVEDAGLHAPDAQGAWDVPEDISFCVKRSLDVTHAARGDVSPQVDWTVELTADLTVLELDDEETGEVTYHLRVDGTEAGPFQRLVAGTAYLTNRTEVAAEIEEVVAQVDASLGDVDCGVSFPHTLEPNRGLECNYAVPVDEDIGFFATSRLSVVMTDESLVGGLSSEAQVSLDFPDPGQFERLNLFPMAESCHIDDAPCEFTFVESYTCPFDAGLKRTRAGSRTASLHAEVDVEVRCASTERHGFLSVFLSTSHGFRGPYVWDLQIEAVPEVVEIGGFESGTALIEVVASAEDIGESYPFVEGVVYLGNATDYDAEIASVLVETGGVTVEADCGQEPPFVFPARSSRECPFTARDVDPDAAYTAEVTVQVTPESDLYGGHTTDGVYFDALTPEPLPTVTIVSGDTEETCHYQEVCVVERSIDLQCPEDGGLRRVFASLKESSLTVDTYLEVVCDAEFQGALRVRTDPIGGFYYSYDWSVEKSVDQPLLSLKSGQSTTVNYWVEVASSEVHEDHFVEGLMYITNETEYDAEIAAAQVLVGSEVTADLDCGVTFPAVVPALHGLQCTYQAQGLTGSETHIDVDVTVTPNSHLVGQRFQRDLHYQRLPREQTFSEVTIRDELNGAILFEEPCVGPGTCYFEAQATFQCPAHEGWQENQATVLETGAGDNANVEVLCDVKDP